MQIAQHSPTQWANEATPCSAALIQETGWCVMN